MSLVSISCPHCGYSKNIDRAKIPAGTKRVKCPECQQTFPLEVTIEIVAPPPQSIQPVQPPQSVQPPQLIRPTRRQLAFSFTGNAREYFGIWIVNTLLKIVTLGIYSPWAKVRKRQYFYGNTQLDDANFDYLANPIALLKGWLIGAAFFIAYSVGSRYSPVAGSIFGLAFFFLLPWVVVRARLFNNRNSAHRNVRFNFRPDYAEAYKVYAWLPILSLFTLGLLTPYVFYRQKRFLVENNSFGRSFFSFDAQAKDFYRIALKTIGVVVLSIGVLVVLSMFGGFNMKTAGAAMPVFIGIVLPLVLAAGYFLLMVYSYVRFANLTWNGTHIGKNRFISTMRVRDMTWIMFSNLVASVLSVGLLIPWASVRLARYRLDNLSLRSVGDLDHYRNGQLEKTSAAGEEIGDIFGVDFGI